MRRRLRKAESLDGRQGVAGSSPAEGDWIKPRRRGAFLSSGLIAIVRRGGSHERSTNQLSPSAADCFLRAKPLGAGELDDRAPYVLSVMPLLEARRRASHVERRTTRLSRWRASRASPPGGTRSTRSPNGGGMSASCATDRFSLTTDASGPPKRSASSASGSRSSASRRAPRSVTVSSNSLRRPATTSAGSQPKSSLSTRYRSPSSSAPSGKRQLVQQAAWVYRARDGTSLERGRSRLPGGHRPSGGAVQHRARCPDPLSGRLRREAQAAPVHERSGHLEDPWALMAFADAGDANLRAEMRHVVLHLLRPNEFERIFSRGHKRQVATRSPLRSSKQESSFAEARSASARDPPARLSSADLRTATRRLLCQSVRRAVAVADLTTTTIP